MITYEYLRKTNKELIFFITKNGYVSFILDITKLEEHYINFSIYEVCSWSSPKEPFEIELYIKGVIKWDGCSHIYFGRIGDDGNSDSYLHLCGKDDWKKHCDIMKWIYRTITSKMTKMLKDEIWK